LKPYNLVYDLLVFEHQLATAIQFVDRHPQQVFVLDHIGKPHIAAHELSPWRENIFELALRPNVSCKLSGMLTEADWTHWTEEDLKPYFDVVIEAFQPHRLMFGSDWPVCLLGGSYERWVEVVEKAIAHLSLPEQAGIWAANAKRIYKLAPTVRTIR
jgi:L-fuconolactonase